MLYGPAFANSNAASLITVENRRLHSSFDLRIIQYVQYMRTASLLAMATLAIFLPRLIVKWTYWLRHSGTLRADIARAGMFVDLAAGQPENVARIIASTLHMAARSFLRLHSQGRGVLDRSRRRSCHGAANESA
jgi:hypothetical protein